MFGSQGWPRGDNPTICQCRCRDSSSSNRSLAGSHVRSQMRWAWTALACNVCLQCRPCRVSTSGNVGSPARRLRCTRAGVRSGSIRTSVRCTSAELLHTSEPRRMYAAICVVDSGPCICNSTVGVCLSKSIVYGASGMQRRPIGQHTWEVRVGPSMTNADSANLRRDLSLCQMTVMVH